MAIEFVIQSYKILIKEQESREEEVGCTKLEARNAGKRYALSPFFGHKQKLREGLGETSDPYTLALDHQQPVAGFRIMEISDIKSTAETHIFRENDRCECREKLIAFPLKCECNDHENSKDKLMRPTIRRCPCAYQAMIQITRSATVKFKDKEMQEVRKVIQRAQKGEIKLTVWDTWISELTEVEEQLRQEAVAIAKSN